MNSENIVYCVVSFLIGMLLAHMLKGFVVCGKVVEGNEAKAEATEIEPNDLCQSPCTSTDSKCNIDEVCSTKHNCCISKCGRFRPCKYNNDCPANYSCSPGHGDLKCCLPPRTLAAADKSSTELTKKDIERIEQDIKELDKITGTKLTETERVSTEEYMEDQEKKCTPKCTITDTLCTGTNIGTNIGYKCLFNRSYNDTIKNLDKITDGRQPDPAELINNCKFILQNQPPEIMEPSPPATTQ